LVMRSEHIVTAPFLLIVVTPFPEQIYHGWLDNGTDLRSLTFTN
jgi:hypothetical protein